MLIDWFTVGAQTLNFLVMVWLLKRFLYKPILDAIDAREKRIAAELADADAKKAAAHQEQDEFRKKNEAFDQQRAALFGKVADEAKAERLRLLEEARAAADALRAKRQDSLQREQQSLNDEIVRRTQAEVFAIARQTLTDLAETSLEERMCAVFTRHLRELSPERKGEFGKALKELSGSAIVHSAFEMPPNQRAEIQKAVNETFSADVPLHFESTPALISGIELSANGRKVAWSIADYLTSLENSVGELLKEKSKAEVKPEAKPEVKAPANGVSQPPNGPKPIVPGEAK